jgi:hypothetical protein
MSRKLKRKATQLAGGGGDFVGSGGDIDNSMFWFGDLNIWGAFPTTPTVYQKPRSQVFYMTRNWFERQVFVRQIILLRFAIFNYGFNLNGINPFMMPAKPEKEWSGETRRTHEWLSDKWYGIPTHKLVAQFVRDAWMEWLIQDNVICIWRKRKSGSRPLVYPVEQCSYADDFGVERLAFAHGLSRSNVEGLKLPRDESSALKQSRDVNLTKTGNESDSNLFDFEVVKRSRFGFGLAWPQIRTLFNTVGAWEALELADWQLCDALRTVYELHKIGHEIKNGPHAGSAAHFLTKKRADAVRKQIAHNQQTLAAVKRLIVNFDHAVEYPRPDPKNFSEVRFEGMFNRLLYWSMPLGQMIFAQSVNPFLMPFLKAQAANERQFMSEFIQTVLVKTLGAPEQTRPGFCDDVFWDSRLLADILKTGLTTGPLSDETWLTKSGFNPEQERELKDKAVSHPLHQHVPIFDSAHGDQNGDKGGRPAGKTDKKPRKSERE